MGCVEYRLFGEATARFELRKFSGVMHGSYMRDLGGQIVAENDPEIDPQLVDLTSTADVMVLHNKEVLLYLPCPTLPGTVR